MSEAESILNIVGGELIIEGLAGLGCGIASIFVPVIANAVQIQYYQGIWAGSLFLVVGVWAMILYYKDDFEWLWVFIIFIVISSLTAFAAAGAVGLSTYAAYLAWAELLASRPTSFAINTSIGLLFLIGCIACIRAAISASKLRHAYAIQIARCDKQHKINEKNDLIFLEQWEKERQKEVNKLEGKDTESITSVEKQQTVVQPAPAPEQQRIKLQVEVVQDENGGDMEGEIELMPNVVQSESS